MFPAPPLEERIIIRNRHGFWKATFGNQAGYRTAESAIPGSGHRLARSKRRWNFNCYFGNRRRTQSGCGTDFPVGHFGPAGGDRSRRSWGESLSHIHFQRGAREEALPRMRPLPRLRRRSKAAIRKRAWVRRGGRNASCAETPRDCDGRARRCTLAFRPIRS